jgi:hypothetical protein
MPSVGGDAPYGSAGRVHADPRDADAGTPTSTGGRHVADVGSGLPGGPAGAEAAAAEPYAFRRGRHGDTTGAGLTAREVRGGLVRLARGEWRPAVSLLAAGLLVAAIWRAVSPSVADAGNPLEAGIAVDGTLAGLAVLAGALTSACVLLRPGRYPVRRTLVVVAFSVLAGVVSWQVGNLLGTPHLRAYGIVLIWPIITSAGLFAGSLLPGLSRRLED